MIYYLGYAAVFVATLLVVLKALRGKRPSNAPVETSVGLPLIGNYVEFAKNPITFIRTCYKKYGGVFTVPMLHKHLTFLVGPEESDPFYRLDDDEMSQPEVYGFMTPVFGNGVVYDAPPRKRMQQMQSMAASLKSARLKVYVAKIEKETLDYIARWGESGTIDLLKALSELTILSASRCLHGDEVRENMFEDMSRLFHDIDHGITPLSFFFPYAPTPAHKVRDEARKQLGEVFAKAIRMRRESGKDTSLNTDVLQVFMDLEYKEDGTKLTEDEIAGLLIALLFAGQHTSSITSTWTMFFLLHTPRVMAEVMKEQQAVLQGKTSTDFDDVVKMEYLQNCVKEALRMHPPLIMLMRMAMKDITFNCKGKTITIPKGDIVVTSPAAAGRLPEVFKNPDEFEPERFAAPRNEHKTHAFAYLGFGGGKHGCLGQNFGLLQVKTIVSILLRHYSFEPVENIIPEPDYTAMVVGPKNHTLVRYKKLSH
jgi:sterol 14-demethylase